MRKKITRRIILIFGVLMIIGIVTVFGLNLWVTMSVRNDLMESVQEVTDTKECILILGAGLNGDKPSPMLKDRLDKGIELYNQGCAPKIIMSGDHGRTEYNEVQVMKQYAIDAGVPSSDIFMDHAGFSTYESLIRARDIFGVKAPIVVTQKYHIYRALFIGNQLGLDCTGVPTDNYSYGGHAYRTFRECIARCKDVVTVMLGTQPTYGGDKIPITGNGDDTND